MTSTALPIVREYDPRAAGDLTLARSGYVNSNGGREHTAVAVLAFGRILPRGYEVHHVNEIKSDNRPENLIVCESRRLHHLLHAVPTLLERCEWLGVQGSSVRLFRAFDPPGTYFCVRCTQSKPLSDFARSSKYASGVRGECADCKSSDEKVRLRAFRVLCPAARAVQPVLPGSLNPAAKLFEHDVEEIRRLYATGDHTQVSLAARFCVTQSTISLIVLRKKWEHVR